MKILILFSTFIPIVVLAQDLFEAEHGPEPNHLTPLRYPQDDYDIRIAEHLFVTNDSFGRFLVRSSFAPEMSFAVYGDSTEGAERYFITATEAAENLWYSRSIPKKQEAKTVNVIRVDKEVSTELAAAIQRVWGKMLQNTKYPANGYRGLDGLTLQFSVWVRGLGYLHGEAWSPKEGLPAELTSLGFEIASFAANSEAEEEPLIKKLKQFERKIPKVK